jgi:hypothetical protein
LRLLASRQLGAIAAAHLYKIAHFERNNTFISGFVRSEDFESAVSELEKQNAARENEGDSVPNHQWRIFQEHP